MDIGNQQRVIIVELDTTTPLETPAPEVADGAAVDLERAVEWPLPLDVDH